MAKKKQNPVPVPGIKEKNSKTPAPFFRTLKQLVAGAVIFLFPLSLYYFCWIISSIFLVKKVK